MWATFVAGIMPTLDPGEVYCFQAALLIIHNISIYKFIIMQILLA